MDGGYPVKPKSKLRLAPRPGDRQVEIIAYRPDGSREAEIVNFSPEEARNFIRAFLDAYAEVARVTTDS